MSKQAVAPEDNPQWYKDAVVYEVHVRAFCDSDGDGMGDFKGLTSKLDYLKDLGITAIWLLPFYPSPLRDDGYDIANYTSVHPNYGTLADFKDFLRESHKRGIRVITELVLNHTSDQHPWFQRSRRTDTGRLGFYVWNWRDYYIWNDTPEKYKDARIIFKDTESSNWSWDPLAKAYYFHRFYSHQPDLNYDNPLVRRAIIRVLDFWFALGVDGLRLDAVPYLYKREGSNCENLPETHAFLRELRTHVDERFKNRMLLAEANQWPEDAAAYLGNGDECHMAFHFPLMPRLFMAIRMENSFPIVDIFQQTPVIPETCQWAIFLRNHDELTLEMVSDEERDYMYRMYAHDPQMRINLGIRRRLGPLLNNDRKKIELMNGLLFSIGGTPIIYYGDEIGMGDNIYLGDRNGVRTPMHWSSDRNAGFSTANTQRLYLPVIVDPEYHYEAINTDTQRTNPDSLLWWMKRLIAHRKRFKALSRGSIEFLETDNRKVLAFVRRDRDETILVVANLSRLAQHVTLRLSNMRGKVPVEVTGRTRFPVVTGEPYYITLGSYAFHWFSMEEQYPSKVAPVPQSLEASAPIVTVQREWTKLLKKEYPPALEGVLAAYIARCRWFGGKGRVIASIRVVDTIPLHYASTLAYVLLVLMEYAEGDSETYTIPLAFGSEEQARKACQKAPGSAIARLKVSGKEGADGFLYDALVDADFCSALVEAIGRRRNFKGGLGRITGFPTRVFVQVRGSSEADLEPAPLGAEQTNTSVTYGDRMVFKLFRRLDVGVNPEVEIGRFLSEKTEFTQIPLTAGYLQYEGREGESMTLGVLQGYVKNQGDAWQHTLDNLSHYFERALTSTQAQNPPIPDQSLLVLAGQDPPAFAHEVIGPYLESAGLLGRRTAQLHVALASDPNDPGFSPEPFSLIYQRSMQHSMRTLTIQVMQLLRSPSTSIPEAARESAQKVLETEGDILTRFQSLLLERIDTVRTRCHGDYHLGQVLYTGKDFVIIDFEGEPARPLSERRLKRSPLNDVAGMIRSFHYAAFSALYGEEPLGVRPEDLPLLEQWARLWYLYVSAAFLKGYLAVASEHSLIPKDPRQLEVLLESYLLEKAIYELGYELNNRIEWVKMPLLGILHLLGSEIAKPQDSGD